ncbi:MAG: hypothetical protein ACE366_19340 [Bradymonadia bacterium]
MFSRQIFRNAPQIFTLPAMLAALPALMPSQAEACSPPLPGLTGSIPESGDVLYANSAIVLQGHDITLDDLNVLVDGEPAEIVETEEDYPGLSFRISPEPMPNSTVTVFGNACHPEAREWSEESCGDVELTFLTLEADEVVPSPVVDLSFSIYDHPNFEVPPGACFAGGDYTTYVNATFDLPPGEEGAPIFVNLYRKIDGEDWRPWRRRRISGNTYEAEIYLWEGGRDPASIPGGECWRMQLVDAAGNVGEAAETCAPCFVRVEPGEDVEYEIGDYPEQPEWSADDLFPGGVCGVDDQIIDDDIDDDADEDIDEDTDEDTDENIDEDNPVDEGMDDVDESGGARGGEGQQNSAGGDEIGERTRSSGGCSSGGGAPASGIVCLIFALIGLRRMR